MTLAPSDVTIGVVTALTAEALAIEAAMDNCTATEAAKDTNHYRVGTMPSKDPETPHGVALVCQVRDGTRNAASVCTDLLRSFAGVRCVIMTGIAGGMPALSDPSRDIRLGDIVSANEGVVDYGHVRSTSEGSTIRRHLDGLSYMLVDADQELKRDERDARPWEATLSRLAQGPFARPEPSTDPLYVQGADGASDQNGPRYPQVHRGLIGSADHLVRDPKLRDSLAEQHGLLAVEMEVAGIAVAATRRGAQWYVVRGISDYCDDDKNDAWHNYASLAAAAYVRALLAQCQPLGAPRNGPPPMRGIGVIVDTLLEVEQFRSMSERHTFLELLPHALRTSIREHERPRTHVVEIVRSCMRFPGGRDAFLAALRPMLPATSVDRQRVEQAIDQYWPE